MVLTEVEIWPECRLDGWSWKELPYGWIWYNLAHNGLERKWSWKMLLCTKFAIILAIMVGFGCNFGTIWVPIRVTSGVNCNCLPALLWELSQFMCCLTLCQICSSQCTMGTIDTEKFENLNLMVEPCFGLIWMKLRPKCWIYNGLGNGLERNQNGLEITIYVPILTILPVNLKKNGSNGLERKLRSSPFTMQMLYRSKNGCFMQENDLSDCLWLGIN